MLCPVRRRATLVDAEEFHRSRRRGSEWERRAQYDITPPEDESESLQRRRRSYASRKDLIDVDPVTGEDLSGRDVEEERRRRREDLDSPGTRRDGGGGDGRPIPPRETGGGRGGGEGACPGCGRCSCCGRAASSRYKEAVDHRKEKKGTEQRPGCGHGGGGEGRGGEGRRASSGGRRLREAPKRGASDASSSEERQYRRSRPDRRRQLDFDYRSHDHLRHGRGGDGHDVVESGHRSDPSGGSRKIAARTRRRQPPPSRPEREGRREDDGHYRRRHRDEYYDSRPRPAGGRKDDDRHRRLVLGYSSDDASSLEEEPLSPRQRREKREEEAAAAVAAAATSARETSHLARHRARDKYGSGGGGGAIFSTPFSTPRRHPAAALPNQVETTWLVGRHGGRGWGAENLCSVDSGDGGVRISYRSLAPPKLPEPSLRRLRDRSASGAAVPSEGQPGDTSSRRRVNRRAREVQIAVAHPLSEGVRLIVTSRAAQAPHFPHHRRYFHTLNKRTRSHGLCTSRTASATCFHFHRARRGKPRLSAGRDSKKTAATEGAAGVAGEGN